MSRNAIVGHFPSIENQSFTITSPRTQSHNCIAYAAGDTRRWWWPDPFGIGYWPTKAQRVLHLAAFQQAFESLGYELTADGEFEDGSEKVAIYCKDGVPTHASRQLGNGLWTSKLGPEEDISHSALGVSGSTYGEIAIFMKRLKVTS